MKIQTVKTKSVLKPVVVELPVVEGEMVAGESVDKFAINVDDYMNGLMGLDDDIPTEDLDQAVEWNIDECVDDYTPSGGDVGNGIDDDIEIQYAPIDIQANLHHRTATETLDELSSKLNTVTEDYAVMSNILNKVYSDETECKKSVNVLVDKKAGNDSLFTLTTQPQDNLYMSIRCLALDYNFKEDQSKPVTSIYNYYNNFNIYDDGVLKVVDDKRNKAHFPNFKIKLDKHTFTLYLNTPNDIKVGVYIEYFRSMDRDVKFDYSNASA